VLARWDGDQQRVVLEPQPRAEGAIKAAGATDDHRNAVELDRKAQRAAGDDSKTAAE
jgi:ATP-dependent Clp protease ATP-binding subunit ClpC